jgi:response regulator RpfG family c-di-GMP phosphodiesterase
MSEDTVLFVDDEDSILRSLQRSLRKEPYRILTAGSGKEGLAILETEKVQLVVSDQRMPVMTGSQFLHEVQAVSPDSVRVILSGYAEPNIIVDAINNGGIHRFIGKPWNDEELKTTLRQCLEHYHIVQENRRLSELSVRQVHELERLNRQLESTVVERTRSLVLAQEVLERLPRMVLGISREREIMVTNGAARHGLPEVGRSLPGSDMGDILPAEAISAVQRCLESGQDIDCTVHWNDRSLRAHVAPLGEPADPCGCVLLLETVPS